MGIDISNSLRLQTDLMQRDSKQVAESTAVAAQAHATIDVGSALTCYSNGTISAEELKNILDNANGVDEKLKDYKITKFSKKTYLRFKYNNKSYIISFLDKSSADSGTANKYVPVGQTREQILSLYPAIKAMQCAFDKYFEKSSTDDTYVLKSEGKYQYSDAGSYNTALKQLDTDFAIDLKNMNTIHNLMTGQNKVAKTSLGLELSNYTYDEDGSRTTYSVNNAKPHEYSKNDVVNTLITEFTMGNLPISQVTTVLNAMGLSKSTNLSENTYSSKTSAGNYIFEFVIDGKKYTMTCNVAAAAKGSDNKQVGVIQGADVEALDDDVKEKFLIPVSSVDDESIGYILNPNADLEEFKEVVAQNVYDKLSVQEIDEISAVNLLSLAGVDKINVDSKENPTLLEYSVGSTVYHIPLQSSIADGAGIGANSLKSAFGANQMNGNREVFQKLDPALLGNIGIFKTDGSQVALPVTEKLEKIVQYFTSGNLSLEDLKYKMKNTDYGNLSYTETHKDGVVTIEFTYNGQKVRMSCTEDACAESHDDIKTNGVNWNVQYFVSQYAEELYDKYFYVGFETKSNALDRDEFPYIPEDSSYAFKSGMTQEKLIAELTSTINDFELNKMEPSIFEELCMLLPELGFIADNYEENSTEEYVKGNDEK